MRRISEELAREIAEFADQGPPRRQDYIDDTSYNAACERRRQEVARVWAYLQPSADDVCPSGCRLTIDGDQVRLIQVRSSFE